MKRKGKTETPMSDWKIVSQEKEAGEGIVEAVTLGFAEAPYIYTIEFIETGDIRKVIACNEDALGEKIERGDFYD